MDSDKLKELFDRVSEIPDGCKADANQMSLIRALALGFNQLTGMDLSPSPCNKENIVKVTRNYLRGIGKL